MKVKDLSGREHSFVVSNNIPLESDPRPRSENHKLARKLLRSVYPFDQILEELAVPGEHLFLDFFIPTRRLVVEVHGEQHYKFSTLFHANAQDFKNSKKRDVRKEAWCNLNSFNLIVFPHYETVEEWKKKLLS